MKIGYSQALPVLNPLRKSVESLPVSDSLLLPTKAAEVPLGGKALVLQRIFGVKDPALEPAVKTRDCPGSFFMLETYFLTRDDRDFMGRVYEFAQAQNADLGFVDDLAYQLADYRFHRDGQEMSPHNVDQYDLEGHHVTHHFTEKDAATARRILASEALQTTELDNAFILRVTNEDYHGINHNNFDFMEQVINRFSAKGAEMLPLSDKFSKFEMEINNKIKRVSLDRKVEPCGEDHFGLKGKPAKDKETQWAHTLTPLQTADAHGAANKGSKRSIYTLLFDVLARLKP